MFREPYYQIEETDDELIIYTGHAFWKAIYSDMSFKDIKQVVIRLVETLNHLTDENLQNIDLAYKANILKEELKNAIKEGYNPSDEFKKFIKEKSENGEEVYEFASVSAKEDY